MIERYTSDGTLVRVVPEQTPAGERLRLVADDEHAEGGLLEPEEAAEIGLALLRWAATKQRGPSGLAVALDASIDRTSRLLGTGLAP